MTIMTFKSTEEVSTYLSDVISSKLRKGKKVLWLIPGGSAVAIAVAVSKALPKDHSHNLTITLTDERYGEIHHSDSNWEQLTQAGFYFANASMKPVLNGKNRQQSTEYFSYLLENTVRTHDYTIGFFGIGPDGHTAGILPGSPAVQATEYAATYDAGNFERITMSPKAIVELNEAVAYATGENKWPVIQQLQTTVPIDTQPAQILKAVPKFTLFTDYEGEKI